MHKDHGCECEKYLEEGLLAMQTGRWNDAIYAYNSALKVHIDNNIAWGQMGLCYAELGDSTKALECFDKAILINPSAYLQ